MLYKQQQQAPQEKDFYPDSAISILKRGILLWLYATHFIFLFWQITLNWFLMLSWKSSTQSSTRSLSYFPCVSETEKVRFISIEYLKELKAFLKCLRNSSNAKMGKPITSDLFLHLSVWVFDASMKLFFSSLLKRFCNTMEGRKTLVLPPHPPTEIWVQIPFLVYKHL